MSCSNTQLSELTNFNTENIIYSEPAAGSIPNSTPAISFKRINISVKNPDNSVGELIIRTTRVFSFGVQENLEPSTKKVNGYVLSLCLHNRDGASPEEQLFTDVFDRIVEHSKDHLLTESVKEVIDPRGDLERSDLKKLNPIYTRKVGGKVVAGPNLYAKLIVKKEQIISIFTDKNGTSLNPLDIIGKYCFVSAAIKIESIFIGNKISFQIKLYEAIIELQQTGMRSLLSSQITPRPVQQETLTTTSTTSNPLLSNTTDDDEIKNDDDDDEQPSPAPPAPTAQEHVRRVVKKVVSKK